MEFKGYYAIYQRDNDFFKSPVIYTKGLLEKHLKDKQDIKILNIVKVVK
jgi:hypothetical protein